MNEGIGEECFVCKGVGLVHIVEETPTEGMIEKADLHLIGDGGSLRRFAYFLLRFVLNNYEAPPEAKADCGKCGRVQAWPHFWTCVGGRSTKTYCGICAASMGVGQ